MSLQARNWMGERKKNKPRRKYTKEEEKERGIDWQGLLDSLLELILDRLPLLDYLSFSDVCRSWKRIAANKNDPSPGGLPWLFLTRENNKNQTRSCFSVLETKFWKIKLPQAYYRKTCLGSFQDWLIMFDWTNRGVSNCGFNIFLLNPFSGTEICFPPLKYDFNKVILSSPPTSTNNMVMLLGECGVCAFWICGICTRWAICAVCNPKDLDVEDFAFSKGHLYILTYSYHLMVIDVAASVDRGTFMIPSEFYDMKIGRKPGKLVQPYLVESCGDVLLVFWGFNLKRNCRRTRCFELYRLDISERAWIKVEDLGNRILLLGTCCSRSLSASQVGAQGNCIYFIDDFDLVRPEMSCTVLKLEGWASYSLEDKRFKNYIESRPTLRFQPSIWLTTPVEWCTRPNPNLCRL